MAKRKTYPGNLAKRGRGYRWQVCVDGQRHRETFQALSQRDAEKLARERYRELSLQAERKRDGFLTGVTVSDLFDQFEREVVPTLSDGAQRSYADSIIATMSTHHDRPMALSTRCIHGGQHPDPGTGAVMPPISLATTYAQASPGRHQGYAYARGQNPTRYALERCVASLEESPLTEEDDLTQGGFAFASGLAATVVALELLNAGDHVVASDDLYGGTFRLMTGVRKASQNLGVSYVDTTDTARVADAITDRTRMIWVETPTNPLLKLADLDAIAKIGSSDEIITVCDNTFATPMLQRPLLHGFDITMHSATKYLGGHSDVIAGISSPAGRTSPSGCASFRTPSAQSSAPSRRT